MKALFPPLFAFALSGALAPAALPGQVLLDETFETPTEHTFAYPAPAGTKTQYHLNFRVAVSASDGRLELSYGGGYGAGKSGGLYLRVAQMPDQHASLGYNHIVFRGLSPAGVKPEHVRSVVLSFDASLHAGRKLGVFLQARTPPEFARRIWASRVDLGEVVGTGGFTTYELRADAASDEQITNLLRLFNDLELNGEREAAFGLSFSLRPLTSWETGDGLQLDNVRLSLGSAPTARR